MFTKLHKLAAAGLLALTASLLVLTPVGPALEAAVYPFVSIAARFSGAPKALTADTNGYLNVKLAGGTAALDSYCLDVAHPTDICLSRLAEGQLKVLDAAGNGFVLDANTDGTLLVATKAGADSAILRADVIRATSWLQASGTVADTGSIRLSNSGTIGTLDGKMRWAKDGNAQNVCLDFSTDAVVKLFDGDCSTIGRLQFGSASATAGTIGLPTLGTIYWKSSTAADNAMQVSFDGSDHFYLRNTVNGVTWIDNTLSLGGTFGNTLLGSSANGKMSWNNAAQTSNVCWDFSTDAKAVLYDGDCSGGGTLGNAFVQFNGSTGDINITAAGSANSYDIGASAKPFRSVYVGTDFALTNATNGQVFDVRSLTELTTIAAAATTDTTIQMPAGAVVYGVSVRVTTVIPTATSFSVGDSGSATRFSTANVSVAANSTDVGTKAGAYYNASALAVRLTMNGGVPAANTGRVRVTIYYYIVTPPTS